MNQFRKKMEEVLKKIIEDEIFRFMEKEKGLSIIEIPTGRGKTHNILDCIVKYREKYPERKIFFITTQLKNLPYEDLKNLYPSKEKFFNEVMKIERNISNYLDINFDNLEKDIKSWKAWPEFKELKRSVNDYKQIHEKFGICYKQLLNQVENDLIEKERNFRKTVESFLTKETTTLSIPIPDGIEDETKYKKNYLINTNYSWLKKIYPTIETDNYKVFMLSMSKFIYGNSTIIEPTYKFINHKITDNAIIFIDEFDSTKRVVDDIILENTAMNFENKIKIFKEIHSKFQVKLSKPYMDTCDTKGVRITYDVMKQRVDNIFKKFFPYDSMQLCKEFRDEKCNFMFQDESLHTLGNPTLSYIIAEKNHETEKMDIKFLTKDEHKNLESDSFIYINSLLEQLDQFFRVFRGYIKRWANRYSAYAKIPEEKAVYSILEKFGIEGDKVDLIMENKLYYLPYQNLEKQYNTLSDIIPDTTYYNYGFDIHCYIDKQEHNEDTEIKSFQKHDTPEKFLKYLCLKSNVIGVSATALISTFDNYNISYLQDVLKENFNLVLDKIQKLIRENESNLLEKYKKSGVEIVTTVLNNGSSFLKECDKQNAIKELLNYLPIDEAELISRKLTYISNNTEYVITRYLDVIKAMYDFLKDENNHAWLFLNWPLLKEYSQDFDEVLVRYAFNKLLEALDISDPDSCNMIVVLRSSDEFINQKNQLTDDLAAGKRRMVFSSYQTLMAGQNLNFPYNRENISNYVCVGEYTKGDGRYKTTDFDGIVLGDITHQNFNKSYEEKNLYESNLEKIKLAAKIQDTYESDYLERYEQENLLKYVLKDDKNGLDFEGILLKANNCPMARNKILQIIMQSVGRITRTFIKNKQIKIYINEKVLGMLDKVELGKHILTPELYAIYDICPDSTYKEIDTYSIRANKNSTRTNRFIKNIMKKEDGKWIENNISVWKQTRLALLKSPTSDTEHKYYGLYFETDIKAIKYYFVQKNDFGTVLIDFRHTEQEFINQNNLKSFIAESGYGVQEVSEEDCRLQKLLKYPGMREYFISNGFATSFEPKRYIMTPVAYQNIYKGALGEECGKFILEHWFNIKLKEIEDTSKFELFDFELAPDVYIDFKHWKTYFYSDRKEMYNKITQKLDACGGKRAYIINIFADGFLDSREVDDSRIVVIQNLLNEEDSSINLNAIKAIHTEDL